MLNRNFGAELRLSLMQDNASTAAAGLVGQVIHTHHDDEGDAREEDGRV